MMDKPQITLTKSGHDLIATDAHNRAVRIPLSLDGLRLLAVLLDGKAANPEAKLGSPSRPTQAMIDAFLSNRNYQRELQRQIEQNRSMEQLKEDF